MAVNEGASPSAVEHEPSRSARSIVRAPGEGMSPPCAILPPLRGKSLPPGWTLGWTRGWTRGWRCGATTDEGPARERRLSARRAQYFRRQVRARKFQDPKPRLPPRPLTRPAPPATFSRKGPANGEGRAPEGRLGWKPARRLLPMRERRDSGFSRRSARPSRAGMRSPGRRLRRSSCWSGRRAGLSASPRRRGP